MIKTKLTWAIALTGAVLALASQTRGQGSSATLTTSADASAVDQQDPNIGRFLDRFLDRAKVAADAANLVAEADKYRREADHMLKDGRKEEARVLLRRAGEAI